MKIKIKRLNEKAVIPTYAKEGDAGFDLVTVEEVTISAYGTEAIKTGLAVELPVGYEMQIRPRSGISLKGLKTYLPCSDCTGIAYPRVQLGTVDAGYRGEIGIITHNPHNESIVIPAGTRLAQAVINAVETAIIEEVSELSASTRGAEGFGSTGVGITPTKASISKDTFIQEQMSIYTKKNNDYGNAFYKSLEKYTNIAYCVRAEDKINRLLNLVSKEGQVKDESLEDTLRDLFNYTAMYLAHEKAKDRLREIDVKEAMEHLVKDNNFTDTLLSLKLIEDVKPLQTLLIKYLPVHNQ